jgi:hypothetical protein
MKRAACFSLIVVFLFSSTTYAAKAPARATGPRAQERHVDDPPQDAATALPTGSGLPTVSKFQTPKAIPNVGCGGGDGGDPCQNDWGDGGYTEGGCNCSRYCNNVSRGCTLVQSATTGCQAASVTQSVCTDCSDKCTW